MRLMEWLNHSMRWWDCNHTLDMALRMFVHSIILTAEYDFLLVE